VWAGGRELWASVVGTTKRRNENLSNAVEGLGSEKRRQK
jgi:hypothetical protein